MKCTVSFLDNTQQEINAPLILLRVMNEGETLEIITPRGNGLLDARGYDVRAVMLVRLEDER